MLKLDRPAYSAGDTYATCISKVRDPVLKARLNCATVAIVTASAAYDAAAERQALHEIVRVAPVNGVTREELGAVYSQRMAAKGSPGRDIYDELLSAPAHGRCPLCAQRTVTTLDHHLPKAHYPALAVTPLNLVPACADCNKAKLDSIPHAAEDVGLHPYFDDIDDRHWLRAKVIETRPTSLLFKVATVDDWEAVLMQRVRNHFRTLGLAKLYTSEAAEELLNIRHSLNDLLASAGADAVRLELVDRADSCRRVRRNGWRTAAYDAWAESGWFHNGGFAATD